MDSKALNNNTSRQVLGTKPLISGRMMQNSDSFRLSQRTKRTLDKDQTSNPFFQENIRRNYLHKKIDSNILEQEKLSKGIDSKFFKEQSEATYRSNVHNQLLKPPGIKI